MGTLLMTAAPFVIARAGYESIELVPGDPHDEQEPRLARFYGDKSSPHAELVQNDFQMTRGLSPWGILVPDEIRDDSQPPCLVYRERAGTFRATPSAGTIRGDAAFRAAVALTEIAGRLHTQGVLHLSINPFNVLWSKNGPNAGPPVRLLGFGRAARAGESETLREPSGLPAQYWPYLSPEQTGRTDARPDERSDYYSIGATLYALFTGQAPFSAPGLEEMLFAILTRPPVPLLELRPDLPPHLCGAVMRMVSKDPGDRPSSAREALSDMRGSRGRVQHRRGVDDSPELLVGRDSQRDRLRSALERVRRGESVTVCISGFSGIGKTTFVRESLPRAVGNGVFLSGKFEQGSMAPYTAFIQAVDAYLRRMLSVPENSAARWKEKTAEAFHAAAPDLLRVFKGLQVLWGPDTPLPARSDETPAMESKRVFQMAAESLVRSWAAESTPFVLFLDDLQWADSASLELCLHLAEAEIAGLLIAAAWRENEIDDSHSLKPLIDQLSRTAAAEGKIRLGPLNARDSKILLARLVPHLPRRDLATLRRHVEGLTAGNPLFLTQFVGRLREERAIFYDFLRDRWRVALPDEAAAESSPDLIAFLAAVMRELPPDERTVLPAVCFPSSGATAGLVAALTGLSDQQSDGALRRLCRRRILEADEDTGHPRYRPAHDNIREAACEMVPFEQRADFHLRIGVVLRERYTPSRPDSDLYEAVEHLNAGAARMASEALRYDVAELDLQAGVKSKAACSFTSAARYLHAGVSLLPESCWNERCSLALSLVLECAEAEFLVGEFVRMNELIDLAIEKAPTFLDSVRAYEVRIQALMAENRLRDASRLAFEVARRLGIRHLTPRSRLIRGFRRSLARTLARVRNLERPGGKPLRDPRRLAALRVMLRGYSPTITSGSEALLPLATETGLVTLLHGLSPYSPAGFAALGMVMVAEQRIDEAFRIGQVALRLQDQVGSPFTRAMTLTILHFFINPWKLHLREIRPLLVRAMETGIQMGEYEHAALAGHFLLNFTNFSGIDLREADREAKEITATIDKLHQERSIIGVRRHHQFSLNLVRSLDAGTPYIFAGPAFDEATMLPILEAAGDSSAIAMMLFYKAILAFLFEENELAFDYSSRAASLLPQVVGQPTVHLIAFYHPLIVLNALNARGNGPPHHAERAVMGHLHHLRIWAKSSQVNFRHRADLVEAELLAFRESHRAERLYLEAVRGAEESRYTQDAALAHRRTALFYERRGDSGQFQHHMREAHRFYQAWGALAVVQHLERKYPWVREAPPREVPPPRPPSVVPAPPRVDIDAETLMRAGRVISSEIDIDAVIEQVIRIIMKCAGATRGVLQIEEDGVLTASLEGNAGQHDIEVIRQDPSAMIRLDSPIANYVRQARQPLVGPEGPLASADDSPEERPRSVLCAPILHRGKLDGIIYLENSLAAGVFTQERLKVVELLAAQAAVSLENAALYRLQEKVAGQTEKLLKAEKLASLGVLTAGVAHEVNNPAHVIRLNAAALSSTLQSLGAAIEDGAGPGQASALTARMAAALQEVHQAVGRIESIVGELKAYVGGRGSAQPVAVNLNAVTGSVLQISDALIRRCTKRLVVDLAHGLPAVQGDFGRLQQMVRNLVENACQALTSPEQAICIRTRRGDDSRWVDLEVTDEGQGIKSGDLPHVTEPLYTTRRGEGGTGLGLSIVAAVVKEHGGTLDISSREGAGTQVAIRLPTAGPA